MAAGCRVFNIGLSAGGIVLPDRCKKRIRIFYSNLHV